MMLWVSFCVRAQDKSVTAILFPVTSWHLNHVQSPKGRLWRQRHSYASLSSALYIFMSLNNTEDCISWCACNAGDHSDLLLTHT